MFIFIYGYIYIYVYIYIHNIHIHIMCKPIYGIYKYNYTVYIYTINGIRICVCAVLHVYVTFYYLHTSDIRSSSLKMS